ncbi:MAG: hypothetical protein RR340_00480 [Cloacibacillus sp.]
MRRKIIGAVLTVLVFAAAAAAAPSEGGRHCGRGTEGRPQLTQAQKTQSEAMKKLRKELREELRKANPDKARARKLFEKQLAMKEEFMTARFENYFANGGKDGRLWGGRGGRGEGQSSKGSPAWKNFCEEMRKDAPDKAKAQSYLKEAMKLRRQKATARFEEMLKDPSKYMSKGKARARGASGDVNCVQPRQQCPQPGGACAK